MSVKTLYPTTQPSLLLDFANVKQLDPRVTFVRTTTATYYDGVTTAKAEENLLLQSQTFDVSGWGLTRTSITANTSVAPDGTTTAETLTADGTSGTHFIQTDDAITPAGQTRTMSVFAKAGTNNFIQLAFGGDATPYANFDLSGGTVGNSASVTASIVDFGSGWYRCIVTTTSAIATGARFFIVTNGTSARGESNSLNTTVLIWGAQLEQRSSVTAYTPTTTQPITNYIPVLQTAAAGQARFDHNPITGESLGLLVEEQRTNLLVRSAEFDNASWAKSRSSTEANTIVAPDGTLSGERLVEDSTASNSHFIAQTPSGLTAGATYTLTVYAKAAQRSALVLQMFNGSDQARAAFNLSTGVVGDTAVAGTASGITSSIVNVGNGWYRCQMSAIVSTSATAYECDIMLASAATVASRFYTGDGYSGIFIWGAQLEVGSFSTSYIPTVASTVTRNADIASMTGTNFSSWYRADEGSVYGEWSSVGSLSSDRIVFAISDNGFSNSIYFTASTAGVSNNSVFNVVANGSGQASISSGVYTNFAYRKSSSAFKVNDFATVADSGTVSTDTSGIIPVVNKLSIGSSWSNAGNFLNGTIKKLAFYPSRLSNAQLQALTA
jgi:hypothetical protein